MDNYKAKDREAILAYLRSRDGQSSVDDIIANAGAEKLRVYPILQELMLAGVIKVLEEEALGAPASVKLV